MSITFNWYTVCLAFIRHVRVYTESWNAIHDVVPSVADRCWYHGIQARLMTVRGIFCCVFMSDFTDVTSYARMKGSLR